MKKNTLLLLCAILCIVRATAQRNIMGNTHIDASTNFIWTSYLAPFRFRVNNIWLGKCIRYQETLPLGCGKV